MRLLLFLDILFQLSLVYFHLHKGSLIYETFYQIEVLEVIHFNVYFTCFLAADALLPWCFMQHTKFLEAVVLELFDGQLHKVILLELPDTLHNLGCQFGMGYLMQVQPVAVLLELSEVSADE